MKGWPPWARWLVYTAILLVALVFLAVWRISARGAEELAVMKTEMDRLKAEIRSIDARRPVLVGPATAGNAWDHYVKALYLQASEPTDAKTIAEIVEHLVRGTRCSEAAYPYDWDRTVTMDAPDVQVSQDLTRLLRARASEARKAGKLDEAVQWLLRACQFARDVGHNGTLVTEMVSGMCVGRTLFDVADIAKSLDPEQRERLAASVEQLEAMLPRVSRGHMNATLYMGTSFYSVGDQGAELENTPVSMWLAGWRYSFSPALMAADAWRETVQTRELLAASADMPWPELRRRLDEREVALRASGNFLLKLVMTETEHGTVAVRRVHAMSRLVRMAIAFRASGAWKPLDDPFGTKLLWSTASTPPRIWSVGPDGIDDGGKGSFDFNATPDIVLFLWD